MCALVMRELLTGKGVNSNDPAWGMCRRGGTGGGVPLLADSEVCCS